MTSSKLIAIDGDFALLQFPKHSDGHAVHSPVNKNCFSQWYPAPFTVDGVLYPTAEQWMMAGKARLFKDEDALGDW